MAAERRDLGGHLQRSYTRWTRRGAGGLRADVLFATSIYADPEDGTVELGELLLSPDEARLIGVRLIEAAALADGDRAIRQAPPTQ